MAVTVKQGERPRVSTLMTTVGTLLDQLTIKVRAKLLRYLSHTDLITTCTS